MGPTQINEQWVSDELMVVRPDSATRGVFAGAELAKLFSLHGLQVANSYKGFSPTYYGPRGESSWIDIIAAPAALVQHSRSAGPLHRLSRELQYVRRRAVSDHLFIRMGLDYVLDPQAVSVAVERPRWDLDTLMLALRKGIGRRDFLEAVEARIHNDSGLCD
eukprot:5376333-Pyramimonas_sp.AAC.1